MKTEEWKTQWKSEKEQIKKSYMRVQKNKYKYNKRNQKFLLAITFEFRVGSGKVVLDFTMISFKLGVAHQ